MVMVFLDESSNFGKQDFVCVAGYIGNDAEWENFAKEWRILLAKHRLASLHTADFLAGESEYKNLGKERPEREAILSEFIGTIRKHIPAGFGVGVDAAHFRAITNIEKKRIKPEVFCFQRLLRLLTEKLREWSISDEYDLFFDDVEHYAMRLYSFLCDLKRIDPDARNRIRAIAFGRDEKILPLQAADVLCYATAKVQRTGGSWDVDNGIFRALLLDADPAYGKPYYSEHWDQETLNKHADAIKAMAINSP